MRLFKKATIIKQKKAFKDMFRIYIHVMSIISLTWVEQISKVKVTNKKWFAENMKDYKETFSKKHHLTIFFPECQLNNYTNAGNGFANI